jgi:hypothetical protein
MVKVIKMPARAIRTGTVPARCRYTYEGREVRIDCLGCPESSGAPNEICLRGIYSALEAHPEACGLLLLGDEHVWIRERGVATLRSLLAAEKAWEEFRMAILGLPCHRSISPDRVTRYLEKVRSGCTERFCQGEGRDCQECVGIQQRALEALLAHRNRARRALAADRFRIIEVPGGER